MKTSYANEPLSLVVPVTEEGRVTRLYLDAPCKDCGGHGAVEHPEWTAFRERGNWDSPGPRVSEEVDCGECDGRGALPTDVGLAILALVLRHGRR